MSLIPIFPRAWQHASLCLVKALISMTRLRGISACKSRQPSKTATCPHPSSSLGVLERIQLILLRTSSLLCFFRLLTYFFFSPFPRLQFVPYQNVLLGLTSANALPIGKLTHYNYPINCYSNCAQYIPTLFNFNLSLTVNASATSQIHYTASYVMNLDETPNIDGTINGICPYQNDTTWQTYNAPYGYNKTFVSSNLIRFFFCCCLLFWVLTHNIVIIVALLSVLHHRAFPQS